MAVVPRPGVQSSARVEFTVGGATSQIESDYFFDT